MEVVPVQTRDDLGAKAEVGQGQMFPERVGGESDALTMEVR